MSNTSESTNRIENLARIMVNNNLAKMSIKMDDFYISMESHPKYAQGSTQQPQTEKISITPANNAKPSEVKYTGNVVKSPIVGTFYASPAPDKAPFVTIGAKVSKGDVVCIIESMKLMNEIQSEYDGTVTEILVKNGAAVEYGQPLIAIN